ncbi:MAG: hypothetical protein KJ670_21225 [Alphaproteobacteria bacterium]|nr:hypothetical protein [Rhizobiaceae bacterium]MBU3961825.1 hypothetical protein [Alphaproteobacteria bacterium]MBU4050449.1 hypothetical protein [Alphaproteobacteria bacterium]MBU4091246.1 hypothetical protein [Alphaproteobacteria bacterium]MBU4158376.1 hypothetical protein [Alphaproteobacteria bacterium]
MAEIYCDVVPHANGWVFLSDGGQSPAYPSYRLAVEAAHRHMQSVGRRRAMILREQGLNGRMQRIGDVSIYCLPRQVSGATEAR